MSTSEKPIHICFALLRFKVSVNTEAETSVMFYLVYEELLARHSGIYQYTVINNINTIIVKP